MSFPLTDWLTGFAPGVAGLPQPVVGGGEDKTLTVIGWLMGRQVLLRGAASEQEPGEPVAYLYNGVRLPEVPEWDDGAYDKALIQVSGTQYYFTPFNSPACYYDNSYGAFFVQAPHNKSATYRLNDGDAAWSLRSEAGECGTSHTNSLFYGYCRDFKKIVWANFDVLDENGNLYLAASEPVPVYE